MSSSGYKRLRSAYQSSYKNRKRAMKDRLHLEESMEEPSMRELEMEVAEEEYDAREDMEWLAMTGDSYGE